jgi:hypothetical protein
MHFFLSVCHRWRGWGLRSIRGMKPPYIFVHSRSFLFSTKEWKSSSTKKSYGMLYSEESTKTITWTRYPILVRRKSSIFLLIDWLGNWIDSLFCKQACVSIHFKGGLGGYSPLASAFSFRRVSSCCRICRCAFCWSPRLLQALDADRVGRDEIKRPHTSSIAPRK